MDKKEFEFRKRLLSTFEVEALEHLNTISAGLLELERMPPIEVQMEVIETVYRESHSLKGAARAVNISEIESICQSLEGVFAAWKQRQITHTRELFDVLYLAIDTIKTLVSNLESGQPGIDKIHISKLVKEIDRFEAGGPSVRILSDRFESHVHEEEPAKQPEPKPAAKKEANAPEITAAQGVLPKRLVKERHPAASIDTIRISTEKLGNLLLEAEEMLPVKLAANRQANGFNEVISMIEELKSQSSKLYRDVLPAHLAKEGSGGGPLFTAKLQEFFNWSQGYIKLMETRARTVSKSAAHNSRSLDRMVDSILDDLKKAMMLPFSILLESFPMLVRDISLEVGKEIDLVISGENVEIDRRILEEMKDALIHLVRNSVDHGIESPAEREIFKKPRRGTLRIAISHMGGNKIEILVSDDGAGINMARVKEAAVKNGVLTQPDADGLDAEEACLLIFNSGVSTSPIITDISGRGLGLAIVREKVDKLGGTIKVETEHNAGTAFRIVLPLTIATFRGVLVEADEQVFIIPTVNVERTLRIKKDEIKTVENRETVPIGGAPASFVRLGRALDLPKKKKKAQESAYQTVLVLAAADKKIAFGVDALLEEQEVLVKSLGRQMTRVRNVSGAAILGSGKPVPILNAIDLVRTAIKFKSTAAAPSPAEESHAGRSIMIVEDSITSRMLLKNILEGAGYNVKTAVDGVDAITALKTEHFDLVVSDIEMPRMNGFELTAKIRNEKKLSEMPVVLVTALETREDREKGIEVGANAYIIKSSFNQSNLLEVIRKLI
ncbi:MAG: response regulator [Deltaproteobacteria bacterium]|nr:response regulator [Deltaproteobacteria bacterium]